MDTFDMIVSNPPYIPSAVIPTLMPEVAEFEPVIALDGKEDGLYFYRRIIAESEEYLKPQGQLLFEIGHDQGEAVRKLMECAGFTDVAVIQDLAHNDRVVCGRRS
jgi:release factor glutamine methyltransferase